MTKENIAYLNFCGDLCRNFDKSWDQVGRKLDFAFQFLGHIPEAAWRPMVGIAVQNWSRWPSNWAKEVREIYEAWRKESGRSHGQGEKRSCSYCLGAGFFTSTVKVDKGGGLVMTERFTWRCGACANWYGVLGEKIPMAYPLEIQTRLKHDIETYSGGNHDNAAN